MNMTRLLPLPFACFFALVAAGIARGQDFEGAQRLPSVDADETLPAPAAASSTHDGAQAALGVGTMLGNTDFFRSYWDPWEGALEVGLNGTDGNTETFNIRTGAKAKLATERLVRTIEGVYIDKRANGVQTARTGLLDGRLEWPMAGSPWNYFVHSLLEYDEFKAFKERLSADTGFGYEFIQNEVTTLVTRAGLSTSREFGGPDDKFNPELLLGLEFKHNFNDKHRIGFKVDYYPTITDFADFRLNSNAYWEMVLSDAWGLSLKVAVIDRYDSTPHGAKPNDLDYSTLLIWAF